MNGREMPVPIQTAEAAKQVITFSYDDQGKIVDVSAEGSSAGTPPDAIKQILATAFATVAPMTLSIGESVTVPPHSVYRYPAAVRPQWAWRAKRATP